MGGFSKKLPLHAKREAARGSIAKFFYLQSVAFYWLRKSNLVAKSVLLLYCKLNSMTMLEKLNERNS
jgi:hypothetical protein